jgi:hypothetical protein
MYHNARSSQPLNPQHRSVCGIKAPANVNRRDLLMLVFLSTPVALDPPEDMSPGPPGAPPPYKSCWSRMLRLMESGSFDLDIFCQICVIRE